MKKTIIIFVILFSSQSHADQMIEFYYTVKIGESLSIIAGKLYGGRHVTSTYDMWQIILAIENNISNPASILPGLRIKVPKVDRPFSNFNFGYEGCECSQSLPESLDIISDLNNNGIKEKIKIIPHQKSQGNKAPLEQVDIVIIEGDTKEARITPMLSDELHYEYGIYTINAFNLAPNINLLVVGTWYDGGGNQYNSEGKLLIYQVMQDLSLKQVYKLRGNSASGNLLHCNMRVVKMQKGQDLNNDGIFELELVEKETRHYSFNGKNIRNDEKKITFFFIRTENAIFLTPIRKSKNNREMRRPSRKTNFRM